MDAHLRAAWCHVLGVHESDISNDSNFFTEGGDSVQAMRLITVAQENNIALNASTIFKHPVFKDMAKCCRPTGPEIDSKVGLRPEFDESLVQTCANGCGAQRDSIEDVFPATDFQLLVFHQHLASGAMMLQTVFEICGAFDLDILRQTWQLLHDKNQILRTRLVKHNNQVLQVVVNDKIQWRSGDNLVVYKATEMSKRVGSGDPLFRYAIVDEGDRSFMVWTCHHGGFDGWSRRLIIDKLQEGLWDVAKLKNEPQGPTFRSFVEWKRSQSDKKSKAVEFWKQYLAAAHKDLEGVKLPSPNYIPLSCSQLSRTIEMKKMTGTNMSVTLPTIGHAAWAVAVGSLWSVDDVLFATVKMGRQMARDGFLPRVELVMGPMMVMNPVRAVLRKDMTVSDFLQQTQGQFISTIQHEHEGWSTFRECFGTQAILPGMIDWHPVGSDLFSRTLKYKAPNGDVGCLKPLRELSKSLTINSSMLVDIYEHDHHLHLRVSYDANIWGKADKQSRGHLHRYFDQDALFEGL